LDGYNLDSVEFDTFGWTLVVDHPQSRIYKAADMYMAADFYERPPQVRISSADELRDQLAQALPQSSDLIDVSLHIHDSSTITTAIVRAVQGMHPIYYSSVHILFAQRFWVLRLEIIDDEHHTERETVALVSTLTSSDDLTELEESPPLYSRYFDGVVPLESDPVARIRKLTDRLTRSIQLTPEVLSQPRYQPST
jgi:hypothetical protein